MDVNFRKLNDCGKVQVTGEILQPKFYRINATFIAERDPIRNVKVDATSTVYAVVQIGLRGGIFQYTNALRILGKPSQMLSFDEAFFCYRGSTLIDQDKCSKDDFPSNSRSPATLSSSTKSQDMESSITIPSSSSVQFSTNTISSVSSTDDNSKNSDLMEKNGIGRIV
ncbi:hypothetical protein LOAG_14475 [Loa loa]|uniref:Uncharacterized protein n=1 Tax=Loa loa TaxID=7209 RepID=A0A1I7VRG3_LOALO|nr:hypothetical protein LOAG_14475 [Loa loa]EFO14048.1 hypothetical protein LOAG_14475 [Loa loa]